MAKAYKCDICGKYYTESTIFRKENEEPYILLIHKRYTRSNSPVSDTYIDLCPSCAGMVNYMINGNAIKESEDEAE